MHLNSAGREDRRRGTDEHQQQQFFFALARYNSDGSLDGSFDGDGKLQTDFSSGEDIANSIVVQSDGKILVAGISDENTGNTRFALARYNSDGSLDTSFDADGKVTTDFGDGIIGQGFAVTVQHDSRIVVAGVSTSTTGNPNFAIVRYNADGSLDSSFNGNGKVTTDINGGEDYAKSVVLQSDGKILVVGDSYNGGSSDFALVRYNSDGSLDLSFDSDGKVTTDFLTANDYAYSVAVQQDEKIVVAGSSNLSFSVTRYNSDGSLDQSFGDRGSSIGGFGTSSGEAHCVALQSDGKMIAAGYSDGYFALIRYIGNGSPTITSATSVGQPENTTAALTIKATDPENGTLTYSLSGGADATLFDIDGTTGAVTFKSVPDFENPADANHDNVYLVQVQASDGTNLVTQNLSVSVTDVDESPTITSASTISIAENTSFVVTVTAGDPEGHGPHYGITGGADQSKFSLNFLTGALSFVSPPDFEHPTDSNHNNVYEVQVAVSDGTHLVTQNISVTVTDVNETIAIPLPVSGGTFKSLFLNGQLHLRNSAGRELMTPVTLSSGSDVQFNGSNAADRLTLDRSWSRFGGSLTFNGNGGNDQLDARAVTVDVTFNGGDGNDTLLGGFGDDTANGGAGLDSLSGGDGYDSLTGGDGNDRLTGDGGEDSLSGGTGADSINGGEGDDSIGGGDANDTLFGDSGNDTITGDAGADSINGGTDDDVLLGNAGNDTVDGGSGDDVIDGGDDNDSLKGSDGDDAIRGGNGNDTLSGGNGNDLLTGSAGNDSLLGDAGIDTLLGDSGLDTLNGGLDIDRINGVLTGPSKDTISDTTKVIDTSFAFDFDALLASLL